jgi:integrase
LVDLENESVFQDARHVKTKNAKTMTTYFFPVGGPCRTIVADWIAELGGVHHFGPDDPLFPSTAIGLDASGQFAAIGIRPEYWRNATAIRRIFKERFAAAGLPYANPHSLRNTLVRLGQQRCVTAEQLKAWSQNIGHDKVLTTLMSYGQVDGARQSELIAALTAPQTTPLSASPPPEVLQWFDQLRDTTQRS